MFLKSVELFGFKSFADRSKIEFTGGISALLGPNGCGKSNVVDSIKWVLGEQSSKTLRAQKMEDVIFNGTESRKAVNVAEVILTIENSNRVLPVDIPEVSLKRRLYRSGESEYFINGAPSKLKEVRELFFDTGIGKSAYSIMEQGKIDQILSNKPEERRYIFEEAAGITRFKMKGAEAERKLNRTEDNMRQVENILHEVKRSYDSLKKQAEKTTKFRELKDQAFHLELDIQLLKLKSFLDQQHKKKEILTQKTTERDTLRGEIDSINENLESNMDLVSNMETDLIDKQKKLYGIDIEKGNVFGQIKANKERLTEIQSRIDTIKAREKAVITKIEGLETEKTGKEDLLKEFATRIEESSSNITSFESKIESANTSINENQTLISNYETDIKSAEETQYDLQNELRGITDEIVAQLDQRIKDSDYSWNKQKNIEERISGRLDTLKILTKGKVDILSDFERVEFKGKESDIQKVLAGSFEGYKEVSEAVEAIFEDFSVYRQSVPALLDDFLSPEGIITRKREVDSKINETRALMEKRREEIAALQEDNKNLYTRIEEYRKMLEDLRVNIVRMKTQHASIEESVTRLQKEIGESKQQLRENEMEIQENQARIETIEERLAKFEAEKKKIEDEEEELRKILQKLESGISQHNKDLLSSEKKLKNKMQDLSKIQSIVENYQMDLAKIDTEIKNIYDNFRDKHSVDISEHESRMFEIKIEAAVLREKLSDVKNEQRNLGHVNLMAPEEFVEVKERYEFLQGQLDDLKKAREDLGKVTKEIKNESAELFLETYNKIKKNFHVLFRRLFGGGRAELRLADTDNVLESGIEIFAQPPGKKLENIALLSGGERSMTAVGLMFATYMVKPSPFCILDEIDAALDEANVGRFVTMLGEFSSTSQFIVITHNKKTVAGAQTLLGVTMEDSGVSRVISIRLEGEKVTEDG